jgi:hypothetical protein
MSKQEILFTWKNERWKQKIGLTLIQATNTAARKDERQ